MSLAAAALAPAYRPGSWGTFFTLTGEAAATLTGLFFLAFSLRLRELQLSLILRTRARYLLIWLIAIAVGSGLVIMPGQPRAALAAEMLVVSVGCAVYTVWSVVHTARWELPVFTAGLIVRWAGMAATWLLSIGAGISLLAGQGGGLYLLAFAQLLGITLEVAAAWTLMVWVGKDLRPRSEGTPGRPRAGPPAAEQDAARLKELPGD